MYLEKVLVFHHTSLSAALSFIFWLRLNVYKKHFALRYCGGWNVPKKKKRGLKAQSVKCRDRDPLQNKATTSICCISSQLAKLNKIKFHTLWSKNVFVFFCICCVCWPVQTVAALHVWLWLQNAHRWRDFKINLTGLNALGLIQILVAIFSLNHFKRGLRTYPKKKNPKQINNTLYWTISRQLLQFVDILLYFICTALTEMCSPPSC